MNFQIPSGMGETVTVVRPSPDRTREIIASDVLCLISPVKERHEYWQAILNEPNKDIRKGDILERDDGSELLVQRNATMGAVTQLDLKDYDQESQPSQPEIDILRELKERDVRIERLENALLFLMSSLASPNYLNESAQRVIRGIKSDPEVVKKLIGEYGNAEKILNEFLAIREKNLQR